VVWDLAVHDVAIGLDLAGCLPVEVTAFGGRYARPELVDAAVVMVRYADGVLAQHTVSWLSPDKVRRFFVAGTAGSARFDMAGEPRPLRLFGAGFDTRIGAGDGQAVELTYGPGEVRAPELPAIEPLQAECAHFLDCLATSRRPRADGLAGLRVVEVLEAAGRSIAEGSRPVPLEG
jgi:predicted dehydrogenase